MEGMETMCCNILIVEDNLGDFLLVESILNEVYPDSTITHNKTISEASQSLSHVFFDAILLDLTLPDSNGMSSISQIVKAASNTPVIVLTGYEDKDFGIKTLSMGVSDYLLKDELTVSIILKSISYSIERNKIAGRLIESEEKYRELFQLSPIAKWVYDLETQKILNVNIAAVRQYGYTIDEFLGMNVSKLCPENERCLENNIYNQISEIGFITGTYKHKLKNGNLISVNIQSIEMNFEGKKARIVLATDITEDLINKEKVIKSNQRLVSAQEIGQLGYWEIDMITHAIFWSDEVYKIIGIEKTNPGLTYDEFYEMVHPDDKTVFDKRIKESLAGISQADIEYRIICPDSTVKYLYHRSELVKNNLGVPIKCEGVIQDITERRNYIKAIQDQNLKLQDIAWIQSHVVRAPLTRLMGLVSLLKNPNNLEFNQTELLDQVSKSANEVDQIIREIVKNAEQINIQTNKNES
ncbi:MAG: PAS domain S-box protein [Opitutaceae bacterium]|nr:PAS domain S-box protein [Cytophagales bacterium]